MNPVTFNERIYRALAAFKNPAKLGRMESTGWRTSPLFVHESDFDAECDLLDERIGEPIFDTMPFYCFRLDITTHAGAEIYGPNGEKNENAHWKALITKDDSNALTIIAELCDDSHKPLLGQVTPVWLALQDIYWQAKGDDPTDPNKCGYVYTIIYGCRGVWLKGENGPPDSIKKASRVFMGNLGAFILSANAPSIHTATVSPDAPGRSVEWIKARTHYTLISHGHPANTKGIAHGSEVKSDKACELTRMAGSRRAHWRTYHHERYRFMRGKRRFIKQTWVGPKEWREEGGKQIYRILEPVKDF